MEKGPEMSRRQFLRRAVENAAMVGSGLTTASFVAGLLGPLGWEHAQNEWNSESLRSGIKDIQADIEKNYGISVKMTEKEFEVNDRVDVSKKEIASLYLQYKALEQTRNVLGVYPPSFLRAYIRQIDISDGGLLVGNEHPKPARGQADREKKVMTLSLREIFKGFSALFGNLVHVGTIHHEIAHLVMDDITESEWRALHPGVKYLFFGADLFKEEDVPSGFARLHGMTNYHEDIATVTELLFDDPKKLAERKDEVLQKKADYLKERYRQKSGGLMDAAYWSQLAKGPVGLDYWQTPGKAR